MTRIARTAALLVLGVAFAVSCSLAVWEINGRPRG